MDVRKIFSRAGEYDILLIRFRLLTMTRKLTYTQRFTLTAP